MRVVLSGASGLIGKRLAADLESAGCEVLRLVRDPTAAGTKGAAAWDPERGELEARLVAGADAVINLNGRNIGDGRWTKEVKRQLRSSRLQSTRTLVQGIQHADPPPALLVNASAIGYYGDRGEELLEESSVSGNGFLAELSHEWEQAALAAASERTRVVALRMGMVVARGGALAKMLPPFRLGLGGPIGSGGQWWSWIAIDDVVGVVRFALEEPQVQGPINVVSPQPVRCREFARTLGRVLGRPAVMPLPAIMARLALGEMADALLLASARVQPAALERLGYRFRVPELEDAIHRALDEPA